MLNVIMGTMLILWTDQYKYAVGLLQYFPTRFLLYKCCFPFFKDFFLKAWP